MGATRTGGSLHVRILQLFELQSLCSPFACFPPSPSLSVSCFKSSLLTLTTLLSLHRPPNTILEPLQTFLAPLQLDIPQMGRLWIKPAHCIVTLGTAGNKPQDPFGPNASGGLTPLSPPSELPEIPVATREQSGLLCFHSR